MLRKTNHRVFNAGNDLSFIINLVLNYIYNYKFFSFGPVFVLLKLIYYKTCKLVNIFL